MRNLGLGVRYYGNARYRVMNQNPPPGARLERGNGTVHIYFPNVR